MTHAVEFVPLVLADLDEIMPLEQACHAFPASRAVLASCFGKRYRNFKLLLDGQVIGFYMGDLLLDEMTLHNICVDPAFQGKGYGRQLLQHFIATAKAHKVVQLWLEVRQSNTGAIALYHQAGFDVAGTRKNYYPAEKGREDALLMARMLLD